MQSIVPTRRFFVADLIQATAIVEKMPVAMLVGISQAARFVRPRHRIMWIARNEMGLSYSQLGRLINRDHSTCRAGVASYQKRFASDDEQTRDEIKQIAGEIFRGERPLRASDDEVEEEEAKASTAEDAE